MYSIIPFEQKNTLAEYMILSGANNRPPMLDKDLYGSWKSRMELYMQNRDHGRMILESVENGPLIWPTIKENGVTSTKKFAKLSAAEKIQADCDMKATNIILQGLPTDIYLLVNHHRFAKDLRERVQLLMQGISSTKQERESWYKEKAMLAEAQEAGQILDEEQLVFLADPGVPDGQVVQTIIPNNAAFQTEDLDTYDSDCDDISNAQAVLMANISNYGFNDISEVPHSETYLNDMENQSVHAMQDFEQTPAVDVSNNKIHSDSNIIPYSQYLEETQQEKSNKEQNNKSITAELERYKERVKTFEQRLNIDLGSRVKMIDSQMDDMIKEKLVLKEQVDSLEQNLSKQIKEKDCLLQTLTAFKRESKEKEAKNIKNEIDLEKRIKELDNFFESYQNLFYLKKAQRIKPTLYDGVVISAKHVVMLVIDDEETLILEEESRSKKAKKDKDPEAIKHKISNKTIDYVKLNKLYKDFGKNFVPQQELMADETLWEIHLEYLKNTQEQADILQGIFEQAKAKQPLDNVLDFAYKHAQRIQELLVYVQDTCPNAIKPIAKKVVVTPKNKVKKVRILQTPSKNMKNKVEAQPRNVNKKNRVVEPICDDNVNQSQLNANSELICATCKKSIFDGVHDMCLFDFVKNMNSRAKSAKKDKKQNIWKFTGHVVTKVGFKWKPTSRTFTIVGNSCPLTMITSANIVPPKKTTSYSVESQKPELKVYSRKPKNVKMQIRVKRLRL
nr:hypothetical protein [Tanacetum cinerariifolium]